MSLVNSYLFMCKLVFYRFLHDVVVFYLGKHLDWDLFIKFEDNIEKFEAEGRELFNIIQEFNEKIEIQVFSQMENNNNKERNL